MYLIKTVLFMLILTISIFAQETRSDGLVAMPRKKALIFGVTGQDGAYLVEFLLKKNYEVHGVKRRSSSLNTGRVDSFYRDPHNASDFFLHYGDLVDSANVIHLLQTIQPDEVYNLAAQSHVKVSFELPAYTGQVNALGTLNVLEGIRSLNLKAKFYQASTSELYGLVQEIPQSEKTQFYPRSPYAVSKLYGFWITKNYREAYGIFACNGILFNHESPLRGETFVTRKITRAACRYVLGLQDTLYLGNLDSKRDWGYAKDYVEAMWLMLQQDQADDYVIATGETHSVREFVELAFKELGVLIEWHGEGVEEYGVDSQNGNIIVKVDPRYYRPTEVDLLLGDPRKAEEVLHWTPKTKFQELLKIMIQADYKLESKNSS